MDKIDIKQAIIDGDYEVYNKLVMNKQYLELPEDLVKLLEKLCSSLVNRRTRAVKDTHKEFEYNLDMVRQYFGIEGGEDVVE